jgi:hypothetical protein
MKKSELKKRLVEALTPDEAAKVEPKYKETYAAMIKGKGPLKLKKYDNPDKVVRGRVINTIKNESLKIAEKLGKTADVGDYKDDFRKSDAPQFKGKSKKKRDQMATAAFLNKEDLDVGHQDDEPRMIKKDIYNMGKYAMELYKKLDQYDDMEGEVDFPHWWQSKITKAKSMLQSAYDYLDGEERISQIDAIMQEEVTDKEENKLKKIKKELNKASKMHKGQADRIGKIVDEDAQEKSEENYSNYFKKMDKNRLEEFVKEALMGPMNENRYDINDPNSPMGKLNDEYESSGLKGIVDKYGLDVVLMMLSSGEYGDRLNETSTDKYDDNPALKGKQSDLPDGLQKAIIKKSKGKVDEYDSAPPNDNVFFRGKTKAGDNLNLPKNTSIDNAKEIEKIDKTTLQIQKVVSIMSDAYMALGKELQGTTNPKVARYMSAMAEQIKDLKRMLKGMTNESFDSLAKDLDKQKGVDKEYAGKIAGKIANIKRKGGGKGPTAKQKKRMAETILKELRG